MVKYLAQGAQPTDRVAKLLEISGVEPPAKVAARSTAGRVPQGRVVSDQRGAAPTATAVLDHVVRGLVDDPETVRIEPCSGAGVTLLEVHVGPGELGRVIGRRGRTAQSIRTVVRAAASRDGVEIDVDFVD